MVHPLNCFLQVYTRTSVYSLEKCKIHFQHIYKHFSWFTSLSYFYVVGEMTTFLQKENGSTGKEQESWSRRRIWNQQLAYLSSLEIGQVERSICSVINQLTGQLTLPRGLISIPTVFCNNTKSFCYPSLSPTNLNLTLGVTIKHRLLSLQQMTPVHFAM